VLLLVWAWSTMMVMAAYTANLVQLMVKAPGDNVPYKSLEHAMSLNHSVCVDGRGAQVGWLSERFPDRNIVKTFGSERLPLEHLRDGHCASAVVPDIVFQLAQNQRDINGATCNMVKIGESPGYMGGGYMILRDYNEYCSSLLADSFESIFLTLEANGFLDNLMGELIRRHNTRNSKVFCGAPPLVEEDAVKYVSDEAKPLGLEHLGDAFLIHVGFIVVVLGWHFMSKLLRKVKADDEESQPTNAAVDVLSWQQPYATMRTLRRRFKSKDKAQDQAPDWSTDEEEGCQAPEEREPAAKAPTAKKTRLMEPSDSEKRPAEEASARTAHDLHAI